MTDTPAWPDMTARQKTEAARALIEGPAHMSYSQAAEALGTTRVAIAGAVARGRERGLDIRPANPKGGTKKSAAHARRGKRKAPKFTLKPAKVLPPQDDTMALEPDAEPVKVAAFDPLPGSRPAIIEKHVDGCRWIVGERPWLMCNEPTEGETPYCHDHHALGTRAVPPARTARRPTASAARDGTWV